MTSLLDICDKDRLDPSTILPYGTSNASIIILELCTLQHVVNESQYLMYIVCVKRFDMISNLFVDLP